MPTRGPARAPAPGDVLLGYEICQPEVLEYYYQHFYPWPIPVQYLHASAETPQSTGCEACSGSMPIHEPDLDQSSYLEHCYVFAAHLPLHLNSLPVLKPGNAAMQ